MTLRGDVSRSFRRNVTLSPRWSALTCPELSTRPSMRRNAPPSLTRSASPCTSRSAPPSWRRIAPLGPRPSANPSMIVIAKQKEVCLYKIWKISLNDGQMAMKITETWKSEKVMILLFSREWGACLATTFYEDSCGWAGPPSQVLLKEADYDGSKKKR